MEQVDEVAKRKALRDELSNIHISLFQLVTSLNEQDPIWAPLAHAFNTVERALHQGAARPIEVLSELDVCSALKRKTYWGK